jgi:hypothetical protein
VVVNKPALNEADEQRVGVGKVTDLWLDIEGGLFLGWAFLFYLKLEMGVLV